MDHILILLLLINLLQFHQTCSTTNYVSRPTASDQDLPDTSTVGQMKHGADINLPGSSHSYCNDYRNIQGHEGSSRPGFTLRQLHIILTPGQKSSPVDNTDHQLHIPEPSCQILPGSGDSQKIKSFRETATIYSTVQHEKHGFKHFHPILSHSCSENHLQNAGLKQSITLGEHLYESYFNNPLIKLKPDSANILAEGIIDQASYQTLIAFFHGLLPEKAFAKIKVHKASGNFCHFNKQSTIFCHCPRANEDLKLAWQAIKRGKYMYKDGYLGKDVISSLFPQISTSNLSPLELYQTLKFHICDGINLICDKSNKCENISRIEHVAPLSQLVSSYLRTVSQDVTFQLFSQLHTFPFLHQLVTKIDSQDLKEKIHVYSSDSFFLHILLSSLGIRFEGPTPLASRLVFEVYQKNRGQPNEGSLYFSILYNGADVTDHLNICDRGLEEGLCSLKWLMEKVEELKKIYLRKC